ncbi:MAG: DUF86 domain-containing protein [Clostridiales bacterium]|jgi:uncharacterized protein with HEPN domain|nr:DUF86 domain-containing protein [Clostridiales bacterium]
MDRRDRTLLQKILDEANIIADLIDLHDCDSFLRDERTKRAVCMTLINIGEMVKLLSDEIKQNSPYIPWRSIAGLRDVTAHGYMTLHMEDIWETASVDVPVLSKQIEKLII